MTEQEFKEMYGEALYADFLEFMRGQTFMLLEGGVKYFYKHDVDNYFASDAMRFFD